MRVTDGERRGRLRRALLGAGAVCLAAASVACESRPEAARAAWAAYESGDYAEAAESGARAARGRGTAAEQGAYAAGLAQLRLGRPNAAARYLEQAAASPRPRLRGEALARLGLIAVSRGDFAEARDLLRRAAGSLRGEDRAQALYQAGSAAQKAGDWPGSRELFARAAAATANPQLAAAARQRISAGGFAIQLGAFAKRENAESRAASWNRSAASDRLGPARIRSAEDRNRRRLYLVQVGRFSTYRSASQAASRQGGGGAFIVPALEP
jgi:tetratricopeptide (TPR) repeat protein